jgi:hypothetical protein
MRNIAFAQALLRVDDNPPAARPAPLPKIDEPILELQPAILSLVALVWRQGARCNGH